MRPFADHQRVVATLSTAAGTGDTTEVNINPWQRGVAMPPATRLTLRVNLTDQVYDSTLLVPTRVRGYYFGTGDGARVISTTRATLTFVAVSDTSGLTDFLAADHLPFHTDLHPREYARRYVAFIAAHPDSPFAKVVRDRLIKYYEEARERHLLTEALAANLQEPRLSVERAEYYTGWYSALTRARE